MPKELKGAVLTRFEAGLTAKMSENLPLQY